MTQTRTFLLIAWLMVAFFLWDAWQKDYSAPQANTPDAVEAVADPSIPDAALIPDASVPSAEDAASAVPEMTAELEASKPESAKPVRLENDVLRLAIDAKGGSIVLAELLAYAQEPKVGSPPVELLTTTPSHYFIVQNGLVGSPVAPSHQDAMTAESGDQALAEGAGSVQLSFLWHGGDGIQVRRSYRLERGSYEVVIEDTVVNGSGVAWRGSAYQQMLRLPPPPAKGGFTNPESLSFTGAAWYSPQEKFEKLKFGDFDPKAPFQRDVTGGWIAMLQHYFVAAVVPDPQSNAKFANAVLPGGRYLLRSLGSALDVAPGASATTTATLYLGPKLRDPLEATAPGLGLSLDYGIFTVLSQPLHALLAWLHWLTGNWGWAIVLLVVIIKAALFKLSEAQYKSFAKMRRIQPRMEALKERYGDDRQKYQMAMMEMYKQEKINPLGGCLPMLVQFPIFLALYWVLVEGVELRHAPWILWIQNLTAPDPLYVLPVVNLATMWLTQKLSPTTGMDPMQKKMMQAMPIVFGVMFAFFPAGLVLYWTTNGLLGLVQQWYIMRRHADPATPAAAK